MRSLVEVVYYKYFVDVQRFLAFLAEGDFDVVCDEEIVQHYIAKSDGNTVRLRASIGDSYVNYILCVKGSGDGVNEIEAEVDEKFAQSILSGDFSTSYLEKRRMTFEFPFDEYQLKLEVDIYTGKLTGIIVAEIEVPFEDFLIPDYLLPDYVVRKMTNDESYSLSNYAMAKMTDSEAENLVAEINSVFN